MLELREMSIDQLRNVVEQMFVEAGLQEFFDIAEISVFQVQAELARNDRLIKDMDAKMGQIVNESVAVAIATKQSPLELKQSLMESGKLKALKITDKNGVERTITADTRAQTIARTELFRSYEETKAQSAKEVLDEPIGIAKTANDSEVRKKHQLWEGWAMPLDTWQTAKDKPGKQPNCRCTLRITERRRYKGEINDSLPF